MYNTCTPFRKWPHPRPIYQHRILPIFPSARSPRLYPPFCFPWKRVECIYNPGFLFFYFYLAHLYLPLNLFPKFVPIWGTETRIFIFIFFFHELSLPWSLAWRPYSSIGSTSPPMGLVLLTYPSTDHGYGWRPWPRSAVLLYGRSPGWIDGWEGKTVRSTCSRRMPFEFNAAVAASCIPNPYITKIHFWVDGMRRRFFFFSLSMFEFLLFPGEVVILPTPPWKGMFIHI